MIQYTKHGNDLYYEPKFNTWFKSSPFAVSNAIIRFSRGVITCTMRPSFKYLYESLNLEPPIGSDDVGWNYDYMAHEWDSIWIDIIPIPRLNEHGIPYMELTYPMEPRPMDYLEGWYD